MKMKEKICQSCAMPLENEEQLGTNKDGSKNEEYCFYCYKEGEYTDNRTLEGMIEVCVPFMVEQGMTKEEAKKILEQTLPNLKRWKK
jgi:hypothetical protein